MPKVVNRHDKLTNDTNEYFCLCKLMNDKFYSLAAGSFDLF